MLGDEPLSRLRFKLLVELSLHLVGHALSLHFVDNHFAGSPVVRHNPWSDNLFQRLVGQFGKLRPSLLVRHV
jgi:hypothetical protein